MTRPFFSRERISHFELFDKHAGMLFREYIRPNNIDRLGNPR